MKVKDLMTKRPITVKPTDTLGKVVRILAEKKVSGCPVVNNGKIVGVVTQTDVIRAIDVYEKINKSGDLFSLVVAVIRSKDYTKELKKLLTLKVREFMKSKVISIDANEDVYRAAALINQHNIDRLPVVKNSKLVGIMTKADIIKALEKLEK